MTITLNQNCRQRLVEVITEGLPKITVTNGMFLQYESLVAGLSKTDGVIPENGQLRRELVSYIDDFPVFDFVQGMIALELRQRDAYVSDATPVALTEIEGFEDPHAKARSLVEQLETLPWKYTISIELPPKVKVFSHELLQDFSLTDRIRIAASKPDLDKNFPMKVEVEGDEPNPIAKSLLGLGLLGSSVRKWIEDSAYIQIDVEGFIGPYGSTTPAKRAIATLRSIYGLVLAGQILQVKYTPLLRYTLGGRIPKSRVFTHKCTADGNIFHCDFDVDDLYAPTIRDLELHSFLDGKDERSKAVVVRSWLKEIGDVLSAGEKGEKIVLAAQWLFDSYAADDPLLSFVQTLVVLEILLGDKESKEEIGLGELLRNRCAYLIAKSHQERAEVMRDFQHIYRVRSQIVHSGKSRLNHEERRLFNLLRWMCYRVIAEEQKLLKEDIAN